MSSNGTFGMDLIAEFAKDRFYESIATNPNFYYGPVTGMIARNAGYMFTGRLFANYSTEYPDGALSVFRLSLPPPPTSLPFSRLFLNSRC